MKGKKIFMIGMIMCLAFGNLGFATNAPEDQPLGVMQEKLFVLDETMEGMCAIEYFTYDMEEASVVVYYPHDPDIPQTNLSPDGSQRLFLDVEVTEGELISTYQGFVIFEDMNGLETRRFPIGNETVYKARSLYTTDEFIVLSYWDQDYSLRVERYDYDGVQKGSVTVNWRSSAMVQGPDGTTLYLQKANLDRQEGQSYCDDPVELIQINWDPKRQRTMGTMRHVVQEKTRSGLTIARFADSQFGLIRQEDAETGIVDYKAPIRSQEKTVRLQIPYEDAAAKLTSGARNLNVEYRGQSLAISMDAFDCANLLAAMPCQDDATFEIILKTDEAGYVTYTIQLYVVEQVDDMTKRVHRKTIQ